MLSSPGSLLRAWRRANGRTQAELGERLGVTSAAVSAWETGVRGIPLPALEELDVVLAAGGCLVGLCVAVGTMLLEPRTRWAHAFHDDTGPVWAWIRPRSAGRVRGLARLRVFAFGLDHEVGPEGLFMVAPRLDPNWAVTVQTEEPVWVDFGRGVPPDWLGVPTVSSVGLRDVVLTHPGDPMLDLLVDGVQRLAGGDVTALRARLRGLVDAARWDALEAQWHRGTDLQPPRGVHDPAPPRTPEGWRALHRRLREARGLSQADAAQVATRLLRGEDRRPAVPGTAPSAVSAMQIHNYETGRRGRVPHLAALLDRSYDAFGTSCFEPVRTSDLRPGAVAAAVPDFWIGPVTVVARPVGRAAVPGPMTLRWRGRLRHVLLCSAPVTLGCLRLADDGDLTVSLPAGWRLDVWMGHDPGARELVTDWVPVSPEVGRAALERVLASVRLAVGVSEEDLRRAILGAAGGPVQRPAAPESTISCTSTAGCTTPRYGPAR
ncbi:helix-turn-helix transcriptional regulator [Intrasporangium sp. YIM S08009]|uniref:helix-turn-helix transcriptional regulator n=1 Tax=Intrasporangium zincisolvens TaxID=3080018 RepID=UPI002B060865|nr:helix-turn-helix transcriptional regulator [Intrasporangium sp. YIM S08009]